MVSRSSDLCRTVLFAGWIVVLLVSPVSAGPLPDPSDPGALDVHMQYLPLLVKAGPSPTTIDLIEAALAQGKIDDVTALVYKVYAVFGDPRLPAEYRSPNRAIREGTEVMSEAQGRYDALPADTQAVLLPFLLPPYYQGSWDDQQPAEGGPVAAAPLTLPAAAALAPGGPPEMPLSDKWFFRGNTKVKVWGRKDRPGDARLVEVAFNALKDKVWPELTGLMLCEPIKDDGQRNFGGDGRLDVALTVIDDDGMTIPYVGFAIMSPVHLRINRRLNDELLRAALAHNFMHSLQFTYELPGNRQYDRWLMESTAVWAEDYVYPEANTEQFYLAAFLDDPGVSLNDTKAAHHYGAYLFPFYLSHVSTPDVVRSMWVAAESTDSALEAVDTVIEGGFKQQWPEFARYNWNRPSQDDYSSWDLIARGVTAPEIPVPGPLDGFPARDFDRSVSTDLRPLAAYYYHFVFPRDDVSSVAFYNPFRHSNDPAVKVQALVKMGGAWQEVEDWTSTVSSYSYCRDARAGRVEELVIILTNSNWQDPNHVLKAYSPMRLVATNVGCWRWRGTTRSSWAHKRSETVNAKAELVLQRHYPAAEPNGNPGVMVFDSVSGTAVAWVTTTPGATCHYSSAEHTQDIKWNDGYLSVHTADTGSFRRLYYGSGGITFHSTYDLTCDGPPIQKEWTNAMFLATGGAAHDWFVSADGRRMDETVTFWLEPDSDSCLVTSEWHFTAEREP